MVHRHIGPWRQNNRIKRKRRKVCKESKESFGYLRLEAVKGYQHTSFGAEIINNKITAVTTNNNNVIIIILQSLL